MSFLAGLFLIFAVIVYFVCLIDGIIITWNAHPILFLLCFVFHVPFLLIGFLHVCFDINLPQALMK